MTSIVNTHTIRSVARKKEKEPKRKNRPPLYSIIPSSRIESIETIEQQTKMQNDLPIEQSRATSTTPETGIKPAEQIAPDPFCTGRCSVCDSGYVDVINTARAKFTLRSLSEYLKNEYDLNFSKDQLNLHFQKYALKLRQESVKKAYELFDRESATLAVHQKQTLFLASYTFEEIMRRIQNGTITVGIDEFEKLMKLYYQIMQDPMGAIAPDAMEIYMRAFKMYKIPIAQNSFEFGAQGGTSEPKAENVNDAQTEQA